MTRVEVKPRQLEKGSYQILDVILEGSCVFKGLKIYGNVRHEVAVKRTRPNSPTRWQRSVVIVVVVVVVVVVETIFVLFFVGVLYILFLLVVVVVHFNFLLIFVFILCLPMFGCFFRCCLLHFSRNTDCSNLVDHPGILQIAVHRLHSHGADYFLQRYSKTLTVYDAHSSSSPIKVQKTFTQ